MKKKIEKDILQEYINLVMKFILSTAGIVVSICGIYLADIANKISEDSNKMQELQTEYLVATNEPNFIYKEVYLENGDVIKSTIENTRGKFINAKYDKLNFVYIFLEESKKYVIVNMNDYSCNVVAGYKGKYDYEYGYDDVYDFYNKTYDFDNQKIESFSYNHFIDKNVLDTYLSKAMGEVGRIESYKIYYIEMARIWYTDQLGNDKVEYYHILNHWRTFQKFDVNNEMDSEILSYLDAVAMRNDNGSVFGIGMCFSEKQEEYKERLFDTYSDFIEFLKN